MIKAHHRLVLGLPRRRDYFLHHPKVHGVAPMRPVERDDERRSRLLRDYGFEAHFHCLVRAA
jgi:hypothetical protein